ncbi:MAG: carboxypeptidase M32, partial [Pseudomonadota bacterium]
ALGQVAGRLGWDQETMMPEGAAPQRAEEAAALSSILHARASDPCVGDWLDTAQAPDEVGTAILKKIRKSHDRATKVPGDLAAEIARVTSLSQGVWAKARADEDFAGFAPTLKDVVRLKREEAEALADGRTLYDTCLDDFEEGMTSQTLAAMFEVLRPRLVALKDRLLGAPTPEALRGQFDENEQLRLSSDVAARFGYDFNHGRMDKAVHPFSSGSGLDVRITTRTDAADPFNCLYSTIHEVGHGHYEQGIDRAYLLTPLGRGASMGVHESQSRIFENQLGRSRAFTGWLFEAMTERFGPLNTRDADAFYAAVNRVGAGYIRTEADEVHYNLHILMRSDLERELIEGRLEVDDLQEAWNARFEADFGVVVDKPSNGCLQDVHWSVGLFGYFPTYTLGNVYAGCLFEALKADLPDLEDDLAKGDPSAAVTWLRAHLQVHGSLRAPEDTITHAIGKPPTAEPLLDYLEAKFGALYGL